MLGSSIARGVYSLLVVGALSESHLDYPEFDEFLKQHSVKYGAGEMSTRQAYYQKNLEAVRVQNSKENGSWKARVNRFAAFSPEEKDAMLGYVRGRPSDMVTPRAAPSKKELPASIDWKSKATGIKNQAGCGSCWAFAAAAVIESHLYIASETLVDLSPQQLTSCTENPQECGGQGGCQGATAQLAFNYTVEHGIVEAAVWPYTSYRGRNGECFELEGMRMPIVSIEKYVQVTRNSASALMEAVQHGPVAISVTASDWSIYSHGVFDGCSTSRPIVNHAVVLMGYGYDETLGKHYWTVRNSWGEHWGEGGYIRLERFPGNEPCGRDDQPLMGFSCANAEEAAPEWIKACGMCGLLSDSSYPSGVSLLTSASTRDAAASSSAESALSDIGSADAAVVDAKSVDDSPAAAEQLVITTDEDVEVENKLAPDATVADTAVVDEAMSTKKDNGQQGVVAGRSSYERARMGAMSGAAFVLGGLATMAWTRLRKEQSPAMLYQTLPVAPGGEAGTA